MARRVRGCGRKHQASACRSGRSPNLRGGRLVALATYIALGIGLHNLGAPARHSAARACRYQATPGSAAFKQGDFYKAVMEGATVIGVVVGAYERPPSGIRKSSSGSPRTCASSVQLFGRKPALCPHMRQGTRPGCLGSGPRPAQLFRRLSSREQTNLDQSSGSEDRVGWEPGHTG